MTPVWSINADVIGEARGYANLVVVVNVVLLHVCGGHTESGYTNGCCVKLFQMPHKIGF